jgi:hypothetical protein
MQALYGHVRVVHGASLQFLSMCERLRTISEHLTHTPVWLARGPGLDESCPLQLIYPIQMMFSVFFLPGIFHEP